MPGNAAAHTVVVVLELRDKVVDDPLVPAITAQARVATLVALTSMTSSPMCRFTERVVRSTFITGFGLATSPTRTSPFLAKVTTDGVVRAPSAFAMTFGVSRGQGEIQAVPTPVAGSGSPAAAVPIGLPGGLQIGGPRVSLKGVFIAVRRLTRGFATAQVWA